MSTHREAITALDAPAAIGPYSHAVRQGDLLFCSGQVALDPATGELVGGTAAEQVVQCLHNLEVVCAAAGGRLADALRVTVYLTDLEADFATVNAEYEKAFTEDPPARVAIGVAALPRGAQVELDAVVALPG